MRRAALAVLAWAFAAHGLAQTPPAPSIERLVQAYLWPQSEAEFRDAEAAVKADASMNGVSRERFHDLEEAMRRGRGTYPPAPAAVDGHIPLQEISVAIPGGGNIPVLVQLPGRYGPQTEWPLMFAMHGGPPQTAAQARSGAERMIKVWAPAAEAAGWIVAAPTMTTAVAVDQRTERRLPYEVFHPEQARAVIAALRARYRIDPDRVVSTGISLGSNFSIAFGCSHPDWLAAIVPVSTEGDSRELLLRNLRTVPVYILEGSSDKNIRAIGGPRALRDILTSFAYDLTYREFGDRAHEGFQEHYDDVLRWLDTRPRQVYPREVVRVPHPAIMPIARRMHWIESDTRQALVRAVVTGPVRIDVTARRARSLKVYLHDRLVDLDRPIEIWVNGAKAFAGAVPRSIPAALEQARALDDERRIYAAVVTVKVPVTPAAIAASQQLWRDLAPRRPEGTLSFWEMYATRALEERFPSVGFEGIEEDPPRAADLDGEQTAVRVKQVTAGSAMAAAGLRAGDFMLEIGQEPFFRGSGGVATLHQWMMRELRREAADYPVVVWRDGQRVTLSARFKLGPYASRGATSNEVPRE